MAPTSNVSKEVPPVNNYQLNYSQKYSVQMYDLKMRQQKAKKIIAVLEEYYDQKLDNLSLLDIGCSTGMISAELSKRFATVVGIDIDSQAIEYAKSNFQNNHLISAFRMQCN